MSWLAVTFTTQEINSLIRQLGANRCVRGLHGHGGLDTKTEKDLDGKGLYILSRQSFTSVFFFPTHARE